MENRGYKISVRNLVEFVERSGDIDSKIMGSSIRAVEGTRAHQRVQKSYNERYSPEVSLKYQTKIMDYDVFLEGRADGIWNHETLGIVIDEIKSTTKELELIDGNNILHWGQVKCYGYIYCQNHGLDELHLQLTYYNIDSGDIKRIVNKYSAKELKEYVYNLLKRYSVWIELVNQCRLTRDTSISHLSFPFDKYRKGQRELAVGVYKTIKDCKKGYFQAPTGIGKTISTLFPTIKALGEGLVEKVFYLTAKTITRQVAEEAIKTMNEKGLKLKAVTLTAKDKICPMEITKCSPENCPYAKGHYDRVNDCLFDVISHENLITRECMEAYAIKHNVCPFELSLDIALWVDCVICDYNYVFDPRVYLKRFFLDGEKNYAFLIDEAHNLVDRAREMFSAQLNKQDFLTMKGSIENKDVKRALNSINKFFIEKKKQLDSNTFIVEKGEPKELYPLIHGFLAVTERYLIESKETNDELLELFFKAFQFLRISEFYGDNYITYHEKDGSDVKTKIFCLDPSIQLKEGLDRGKSSIFFSATLNPLPFYQDLLGGEENDYLLSLPSPFEPKKMKIIVNNISTYYKDRDESLEQIAKNLFTLVMGRKGNYFAFFPSYTYMNRVYEQFIQRYPMISVILQDNSMDEKQREDFLNEFVTDKEKYMLAFGVLGGIFSEGIDLVGDKLIGVAIIGVGLPQLCLERDLISDYFNQVGLGYEYSYMYPGFNKVLQGAGRLIRTESDRGILLLMDKRYNDYRYKRLFPSHWNLTFGLNKDEEISDQIVSFWE